MSLTAQSAARKDKRTASNGPALEHRHFAFIAQTILEMESNESISDKCRYEIAHQFAAACATTNPRFDYNRFIAACGVKA